MTLAAAYLDDVAGAVFWLAFAAVLVWAAVATRRHDRQQELDGYAAYHGFARPDVPDHASVTKGTTHVRHQPTARAGDGDGPRGQRSPRRGAGRGDGDRLRGLPGRPEVAERRRVGTTVDPSAAMTADPMDDDRIVGAPW